MKVKVGEFVKLNKPEQASVIGQGEASEFMKVKINQTLYLLPFGGIFKVSSKCDNINKIANLKTKPYSQIHKNFVEKNSSIFQIIKGD